jgi:hypothetical protein
MTAAGNWLRGSRFTYYYFSSLLFYRFKFTYNFMFLSNWLAARFLTLANMLRSLALLLWRSWLRHCATNRKVAGSIPDGVIENFY